MPPYRSAPQSEAAKAPSDQGIVGDIIEQFADKFACYRELVQNALDAGTEKIHVTLRYRPADEIMRVSILDDGCGMSREILENRLLVLFRSTKENDDTKIGKFGVGFASVLAMGPEIVKVTSVHEGERHALHLYPDLNYELFELGRAQKSGTRVELEIPLSAEEVDDFNTQSWSALAKWCEHARAAIYFKASDTSGQEFISERIDCPLSVNGALVEVKSSSKDGKTQVVVAAVGGNESISYYNSGLLLHRFAGRDEWLGWKNVSLKVQDPRLGHTISRDDVIRDENWVRAVSFAKQTAERSFPNAILRRQRELAAEGNFEYLGVFYRLLLQLSVAKASDLRLPIVDRLGGDSWTRLGDWSSKSRWTANESSPMTRLLAANGVPVVDTKLLNPGILRLVNSQHLHVDQVLSLVEALETQPPFTAELKELLSSAYRKPSEIVLARVHGRASATLILGGGVGDSLYRSSDEQSWILSLAQQHRDPLALLRRPTLVLNADHPAVQDAQRIAEEAPVAAASILCRLILLDKGVLSERRSKRLLQRTLEDELEALL